MKTRIVYCEDQEQFRKDFKEKHGNQFDIHFISDAKEVMEYLESSKELPDILLLDLYHPQPVDDYEEKRRIANEKLHDLSESVKDVKRAVDQAWVPDGVSVLKQIRTKYSSKKLPIMIYSQRGLLLLEDQLLQEVERNQADWLIKDRERISPATEELMIRDTIDRFKHKYSKAQLIRALGLSILTGIIAGLAIESIFSVVDLIARYFF
ncbi:MAG: hypothetical protein H6842_03055 [Rhodospirillaceae bacterium]|nr:hypothetical protein [Rhodospirillaceae bacterium]